MAEHRAQQLADQKSKRDATRQLSIVWRQVINRVSNETRDLDNKRAWYLIESRLEHARVPRHDITAVRMIIWRRRAKSAAGEVPISPVEKTSIEHNAVVIARHTDRKISLSEALQLEADANLQAIDALALLARGDSKTRIALNASTTVGRLNVWLAKKRLQQR